MDDLNWVLTENSGPAEPEPASALGPENFGGSDEESHYMSQTRVMVPIAPDVAKGCPFPNDAPPKVEPTTVDGVVYHCPACGEDLVCSPQLEQLKLDLDAANARAEQAKSMSVRARSLLKEDGEMEAKLEKADAEIEKLERQADDQHRDNLALAGKLQVAEARVAELERRVKANQEASP